VRVLTAEAHCRRVVQARVWRRDGLDQFIIRDSRQWQGRRAGMLGRHRGELGGARRSWTVPVVMLKSSD
jgi:hypothetical protein